MLFKKKEMTTHTQHLTFEISSDRRRCIDVCTDCWKACREAESYSLKRGRKLTDPSQLILIRDCAYICSVAVDFMLRGSRVPAECRRPR